MNKKIIIKAENNKYFFNKLKNRIPIYDMYKIKIDMISLINRKIPKPIMILGSWKKVIKYYDTAIFFDTMYDPYVSKIVKKKNPKCKAILFFWNKINDKERLSFLEDKNIDEFWTFDEKDAREYNMKLNTQFYSKEIISKNKPIKTDIYFLGRDKNRKEELLKWNKIFQEQGLNSKIEFLENERNFIEYDSYLENVYETKCLLDYNVKDQTGLSLRIMESLFFQKKCITNNKNIMNYDFYHPNNIFILEKDNIKELKQFLKKPYHTIKKDIIDYYDIQEWLERF